MTDSPSGGARWRARGGALLDDRLTMYLAVVFVIASAFYLWTAATSYPLSFAGNPIYTQPDFYNKLARAFLHLHLSIGAAPAGLLHLANPYDPSQNVAYQAAYHDLSLYHGRFYLDWGPAPLVLLVPLNVLGLSASSSLTAALFAIGGLAFALGSLRVLLREFDAVPTWMGVISAAALACSTTIPFLLRRPLVYEEAIAAGFFFVMAGVYIAVRTITRRRGSLGQLALMSLCFGLATGSRPPLIATGLLIVPVYLAVRHTSRRRGLLAALGAPFSVCVLLLLAYNYARFGDLLQVGQSYQLSGFAPQVLHFGKLTYLLPNFWFYGISPPRPTILFPFLSLAPPLIAYPLTYPSGYLDPEITGGLLTMTPLLLFAFVLPWLRWRRPQLAGVLASPLLIGAGAGLFALVFLGFEFPAPTERYETDFAALFLLAAFAAWFALSIGPPTRRRKTVRVAGAVLALWGCLTGVAISFTGYANLLQTEHSGTWSGLESATSSISTAIALLAGHPILAQVQAPGAVQISPEHLTTVGVGVESFSLPSGTSAELTVVSPDSRQGAIVATMVIGGELAHGGKLSVRIKDGPAAAHYYRVAHSDLMRIPIKLTRGLNHVLLTPVASATNPPNPAVPTSEQLLIVPSLGIAGRY